MGLEGLICANVRFDWIGLVSPEGLDICVAMNEPIDVS